MTLVTNALTERYNRNWTVFKQSAGGTTNDDPPVFHTALLGPGRRVDIAADYRSRGPVLDYRQRHNIEVHLSDPKCTQPMKMSTWKGEKNSSRK